MFCSLGEWTCGGRAFVAVHERDVFLLGTTSRITIGRFQLAASETIGGVAGDKKKLVFVVGVAYLC